MRDPASAAVDAVLLADFQREVYSKTPHIEGGEIVNPSPLIDLTRALGDCAREEYGLDLSKSGLSVFGKYEGSLPGGSIKTRPAVRILYDAISRGALRRGQVVFEATSGNFGIALGELEKLGVEVVALVSRRLQEGVMNELESSGVKTIDLDVDICPAPGVQTDPNLLVAKVIATNMRERLSELGLDPRPFDEYRERIEQLLSAQDVINLAKLLAEAYSGFCPAQYENELNVLSHQTVTGPEIDQQLRELGLSLGDFSVVCAFGTGGTSAGLSRFILEKYGKKTVHVVFPREGQDVAGIRTRSKSSGLRFYQPEMYAGQHDVDSEQSRRLLRYLVRKKGLDIGESSALAMYAIIQMVNFGFQGKFVVLLADGIGKYHQSLESVESLEGKAEVTLEEANAHIGEYGAIVWTHPAYVPNAEGMKLVMSALDAGGGGDLEDGSRPRGRRRHDSRNGAAHACAGKDGRRSERESPARLHGWQHVATHCQVALREGCQGTEPVWRYQRAGTKQSQTRAYTRSTRFVELRWRKQGSRASRPPKQW